MFFLWTVGGEDLLTGSGANAIEFFLCQAENLD